MSLEELTEFELLQGFLILLFVLTFLILGLNILFKYFKHKKKEFITIGLTLSCITSLWWGTGISFIGIIFFNFKVEVFWDLFFGGIFVPFALLCWIYSFCVLTNKNLKKKLTLIYLIIGLSYDIAFLVLLNTNTDLIGTKTGIFYTQASPFVMSFQMFAILSVLITGLIITKKALQSDDPKIQLKGKFLSTAFITFTLCAMVEAVIPLNSISLVVLRLAYISAGFEYYFGFLLPEQLAKLLIKNYK